MDVIADKRGSADNYLNDIEAGSNCSEPVMLTDALTIRKRIKRMKQAKIRSNQL